MAPSSPVRGSHLSMMNNQFHQDQEQYEPLSLCSTYRDLALNDENENDNSHSSFDKSTTSASATVPHFAHDKYHSSSSVAASPIRMKNNNNKFAAASPLRMTSSASALGASPLNTSTRRQRQSSINNTKSVMPEVQQQQTHRHQYHTRNDSIISIVEHAEEQQQQVLLPSQANIMNDSASSPPRSQHQYFNPFGDDEEDIDLNLSHLINSPTSATTAEDRHHAEAAAMLISPEATHHHHHDHHHHDHDDNKKQQHERGMSGVQDLLGDLDDDDMMMMVDDSAEEVQRLRDLADERQQTIFDLQGQLSEAEEFQKDFLLRNETLQSEARSLRSAMADQGSALGEFLCFSPSSSTADRIARSEADCGEFSSPQRGGGGSMMMTPNKNGNIKSHYQQLWLLQQHLQKSGDSILLRSPSSGADVLSRKEYRDAEISCDLESENNLSVSMRTVKKLPFGDDDDDENDDQEQNKSIENDDDATAVDIPVNQVGGTYYLMPPKASHRNKRRQLHRNRAARSSKNLINISATRTTRTLSVVSSSPSSYENSADRLRGGKINYKLMAKNSTAGTKIGGRFSFFRFLFEW